MTKPLSRSDYKILSFVFPLLFLIAYFQTRGVLPPQYSPTTGVIVWPLRLLLIYVGLKGFVIYRKKNYLVFFFLVYSVFTIVSYLLNGFPLELYLLCCIFFLCPVLFIYVGLDANRDYYYWFYKSYFWACVACCTIGIFLFFVRPEWYNTAVIAMTSEHFDGVFEDEKLLEWSRFSSYLGDSYDISYITMACVPIGLFLWSNEEEKRKSTLYLIATIILYFSSLLCQQRAAMLATTLAIIGFVCIRNQKNAIRILLFFLLVSIIVGLILIYAGDNEVVSLITTRFGQMSYNEAMGERVNQHEWVLSSWNNYFFGEGIGSASGFARKYNMVRITDGAYWEILYELGVFGFIVFIFILLSALIRALKYKRHLFIELSILASFMIAMLGACPFVYFFYMFPFWFAIGRIMNKDYLCYLKNNQLKV